MLSVASGGVKTGRVCFRTNMPPKVSIPLRDPGPNLINCLEGIHPKLAFLAVSARPHLTLLALLAMRANNDNKLTITRFYLTYNSFPHS